MGEQRGEPEKERQPEPTQGRRDEAKGISTRTIEAVRERVEAEFAKYERDECLFKVMLVIMFVVGIVMLFWGCASHNYPAFAGGGVCEGVLCWSIVQVRKLWERKIDLGTVLSLVTLVETRKGREHIDQLLERLIKRA